jgi:hypothetical protein
MKKIILFALALNLVSCNDDDAPTAPIGNNADAVFDHYTVESTTTQNESGNTSGSFVTANLQGEKYFSETSELFLNGVGQGQSTQQHYFYEDGLLVKKDYTDDTQNFFYDSERRLTAINWHYHDANNYYRMVYVTDSQVFFERLTLAYDDPAATVAYRIVLELDDNDNVIKAGKDADLDGVANWYHTFDYNAAGNLTTVHEYGGSAIDIEYAAIKDNFAKLNINTYGKKNLMVYQAECYANLLVDALRESPDLRMMDTVESVIEIQAVPYYFRKTKTLTLDDAVNTTVTTFYFD